MAHRRSFRTGGSDRKKTWKGVSVTGAGLGADPLNFTLVLPGVAGSVVSQFFFSAPGEFVDESTILRTYLQGFYNPKAITGGSGIVLSVGIGLVSAEAAAGGVVPEPGAAAGIDSDLWYGYWSTAWNAGSAGFLEPRPTTIDTKAKRKFQSGKALVVVASLAQTSASSAGSLQLSLTGRVLLLLP